MPSNQTFSMAQVIMECRHTNTYGKPWPVADELAWCNRCEQFRSVIRITIFRVAGRDRSSTYTKSSHPTHYISADQYPRN